MKFIEFVNACDKTVMIRRIINNIIDIIISTLELY